MKKRINLNWKNVIIESLGLILLTSGIKRLYFSSNPIIDQEVDELTPENMVSFHVDAFLWSIGALLVVAVFIVVFKLKTKQSIRDTILAILIIFLLIPTGFFNKGLINSLFNYFGYIFTNIRTTSALINGILLTLSGLLLLKFSFKYNKIKSTHNNSYNPLL